MAGIGLGVLSGFGEGDDALQPGLHDDLSQADAAAEDLTSPEQAFRVLGDAVWRFLRRSGVHPAAVEDVTQDVFVIVVRRWDEFRGESSRKTWVLAIAARVAANQRRRQRRPVENCDPLPAGFEATKSAVHDEPPLGYGDSAIYGQTVRPDPQDELAIKQAGALVDSILRPLSDNERSLFIFVEMEGFQVPEVAPALNLSSRQAHTLLERVRRHFNAEIARHLQRERGRLP